MAAMDSADFAERCERIIGEVERAVVGKREALELRSSGCWRTAMS